MPTTTHTPDTFAAHLARCGKSANTIAQNERIVRRFLAAHPEPTPRAYAQWLATAKREGASAAVLRARKYAGKAWFEHAGQDARELGAYALPPVPAPVPHPLPGGVADVRKMLETATEPARVLIALQGLAGLRVAEARTLRRERIDAARGQLVVLGKGGKTRRVPVSAELARILDAAPQDGPLVGLSDSGARRAVRAAAARAGVRGAGGGGVASHDLRATFATTAYERTRDILLVSRLLGHSSVTITQSYLGADEAKTAAAVEF